MNQENPSNQLLLSYNHLQSLEGDYVIYHIFGQGSALILIIQPLVPFKQNSTFIALFI